MKYKVVWADGASKRQLPTIYGTKVGGFLFDAEVDVVEENVPDREEPNSEHKKWVKTADGFYVASIYPDSTGIGKKRLEKILEVPPSPTVPSVNFDLHVQVRDGLPKSVTMAGKTAYFE